MKDSSRFRRGGYPFLDDAGAFLSRGRGAPLDISGGVVDPFIEEVRALKETRFAIIWHEAPGVPRPLAEGVSPSS